MNQKTNSPEQQMMQFILGKWISKPIYVAVKLGIPDILGEENKSIKDLAELTDTSAATLYRMMRALAGVGIFFELENRIFKNTTLSEGLMKDRLKSAVLMFQSPWHDSIWENLQYSIQTGKPAFEKVFGESAFEWFGKNPEEATIFHEANSFKAASSHRVITEVYDFSGIKTLTDVGGGLGSLMIEILNANPHMKGVVAELLQVVPQLNGIIKENKLERRMSAVECDFFKKIPSSSDAYLFSHILHDWSDDKCITILKNCRKAIPAYGKLLIVEGIIPPGNEFSISKLLDLEVLLMGGGCERTENEFRSLLNKSGFKVSQVIRTEESISIIEGVPK
jgi:hypothetical protein